MFFKGLERVLRERVGGGREWGGEGGREVLGEFVGRFGICRLPWAPACDVTNSRINISSLQFMEDFLLYFLTFSLGHS